MIGGIGLDLDRKLMYYKELNFVASMSYGPGRYERDYEEKGLDLPIAYVRWTENRNMLSYLEVANNRQENFESLIGNIINFEDAEDYLNSDNSKNLDKPLIIIKYTELDSKKIPKKDDLKNQNFTKANKGITSIGLVGAGGFAKNFILPNLNTIKDINISVLASSDTASVVNMKEKYDINLGVSSIDEALECSIDGILIANRHSEHFESLKKALAKDKSVFIEKPTVNKIEELEELIEILSDSKFDNCHVYTGYNRAYSPHINFVNQQLDGINSPILLSYQMNAGLLKSNNWQYDIEEGGRNIGEAVHIYHLFGSIFKSTPSKISVTSTDGNESYKSYDNFFAVIEYENGCVGCLTYTSLGSNQFPKESFVLHCGGKTITSENYTETKVAGGKTFKTQLSEKGHKEVLESFINSIKSGAPKMTRQEQISTMNIAFAGKSPGELLSGNEYSFCC